MTPDEKREYEKNRSRQRRAGQDASTSLGMKSATIPVTTHISRVTLASLGRAAQVQAKKGGIQLIEDMNERQAKLGKKMQDMASRIMDDPNYEVALMTEALRRPEILAKLLETGIKVERMALANPLDQQDDGGAKFEFSKRVLADPSLIKKAHGLVMEAMGTVDPEDVIDMHEEGITG